MQLSDLKLEHWPTSRLIPYARNPRKNDHAVEQMAGAIREFGFRLPIIAKSTGEICDGHLRYKAALHLGLEQVAAAQKLALDVVPVVVLDHLTPTQRRAYILADNQLTLQGGWNEELLAAELAELSAAGFDLALTGFSDKEIDDLLGDADLGDETNPPIGGFTEDADEDIPQAPTKPLCSDCLNRTKADRAKSQRVRTTR